MAERRLFWIREQQKSEKLEPINDDINELEISHSNRETPYLSDLKIPPEVI